MSVEVQARPRVAAPAPASKPAAAPAKAPPKRPANPHNPFLAARREWAERYGEFVTAARQWRLVGIASLLTAFVAVVGLVYVASQNHFIPYVVEVDRFGQQMAVGRADQAASPDARMIRAQLARWVSNVRTIYADAAAQRAVLDEAYSMLTNGSAAFNGLNRFYQANNPFDLARRHTRSVQVRSALPLSARSWQLEWDEVQYDRNGVPVQTDHWQVAITFVIQPPTEEDAIMQNPAGIYITEFNWTKKL